MRDFKDLHIAIFLPSLRGGGAERAMLIFAEGLLSLGVRVDIVVVRAEGALVSKVPTQARLVDLDKPRMLMAVAALWKYLRSEKPLAVYSTIVHTNVAAILAAKFGRTGTRVIVRESNSPISEVKRGVSRMLMHRLAPLVYPFADKVIAVSQGVASELKKLRATIDRKLSVLPTPVITESFYELAAQDCPHPWLDSDQSNVILGAGRLVTQKDFPTLISAFAIVRSRLPEARLIILGEGALREQFEAQIRELGLEDVVDMPGFVDNPLPYMSRARMFVLSSLHEGMPNVLIQALALKTPVVATDCKSGPRECLMNGRYGALVPVGDVDAMASTIVSTWSSSVSSEAIQYCKDTFSAQAAAACYLELLDDVKIAA